MADSHDHLDRIRRAVEVFNDLWVKVVLHAGDYVAPFVVDELAKLDAPLKGVFGNNVKARISEVGEVQAQPLFIELAGRRIAMVHEPGPVEAFAASGLFNVVIFGHTHQAELRETRTLVLNPGEVCGWLTDKTTVAALDLATLHAWHIEL